MGISGHLLLLRARRTYHSRTHRRSFRGWWLRGTKDDIGFRSTGSTFLRQTKRVQRNLQLIGFCFALLACRVSLAKPAVDREWPYEEGLHLRPAIGVGASGSAVDSGFVSSAGQELDGVLHGVSIVGELFIEQVVARGWSVGGVVYAQAMFQSQLHEVRWVGTDGGEIEFRRTTMLMAGATGSYHFDGGFYVTGSAGLLWWNTFRGKAQEKDVTVEPHSGPGFGLVPGIGYEWLGVERSMGVLFQVVAGGVEATDDSGTEWAYNLFLPAFLVTMAFH